MKELKDITKVISYDKDKETTAKINNFAKEIKMISNKSIIGKNIVTALILILFGNLLFKSGILDSYVMGFLALILTQGMVYTKLHLLVLDAEERLMLLSDALYDEKIDADIEELRKGVVVDTKKKDKVILKDLDTRKIVHNQVEKTTESTIAFLDKKEQIKVLKEIKTELTLNGKPSEKTSKVFLLDDEEIDKEKYQKVLSLKK